MALLREVLQPAPTRIKRVCLVTYQTLLFSLASTWVTRGTLRNACPTIRPDPGAMEITVVIGVGWEEIGVEKNQQSEAR